MEAILKINIYDDEDYIIRQKGEKIKVKKVGSRYKWEYLPGKFYLLDESEVEELEKCRSTV